MDDIRDDEQQVQDAPDQEGASESLPEDDDLVEAVAESAEAQEVREVAEEATGQESLDEASVAEEPEEAPAPGTGGEPEEHDIQEPEQAEEASVTGVEGATDQQQAAVIGEMAEQHAEAQDEDAAPPAEETAMETVDEVDEPVGREPVQAEEPVPAPSEAERPEVEDRVEPGEPEVPQEQETTASEAVADEAAREPEEQPPAEEPHAPAAEVAEDEEPEPAPEVAEEEEREPAVGPEGDGAADPFAGPGDWYVIHTYSGYENKVKTNLESRIQSMQMQDKIFDVVIPLEDVIEVKGGKKQVVKKKVFPGYLLVKMDYDDDSWFVVRNTPGVTGFVSSGTGQKPTPLPRHEVEEFLTPKEEEAKPQFRLEFEEGDVVRIIAGPFADFNGTISEINVDQSKVKVMVNIFDRETPVELSFDQVARV